MSHKQQPNSPDQQVEPLEDGDEAMTHQTFLEQISLWLDDELDPAEAAGLQTHLTECSACRLHYQAMQHLDRLLAGTAAQVVAPRPGFSQRFETRLAGQRSTNRRHLILGIGALLLGTLFFGLVGGALVWSRLAGSGLALIDVNLLYRGLVELIETSMLLSAFIGTLSLWIKASLITMSQPLFWVYTLVAVGLVWLWVRLLQALQQRPPTATIEFLI